MKVAKKDECLARSLLWNHLNAIGFPSEHMEEQIDRAWPGELQKAKLLNRVARLFENDLDGCTTEEEIKLWSD